MECQQTGKGKARRNQLKIHLPPSVNFCFGEEMKKEAQREHHGSNSVLIVLSELGRTASRRGEAGEKEVWRPATREKGQRGGGGGAASWSMRARLHVTAGGSTSARLHRLGVARTSGSAQEEEPDDEGGGAEEEEGGDDDADFLVAVKSGHVGSNMNPDGELRKLKDRFATWKKYKYRLKEIKFLNSGWIITASYNLCNHWYIERWRVVVYNGGFGVQEPDAN
uniref:Uncharacterized protein n=1 Tax=Oryza barthii TaxID=65489 RepID=A0A0D3FNE9_9ORYZ